VPGTLQITAVITAAMTVFLRSDITAQG